MPRGLVRGLAHSIASFAIVALAVMRGQFSGGILARLKPDTYRSADKGLKAYKPKIRTAAWAIPTKPPGTTPKSRTKRQQRAKAVRSAHDEGTFSSEDGDPNHITFTTLK